MKFRSFRGKKLLLLVLVLQATHTNNTGNWVYQTKPMICRTVKLSLTSPLSRTECFWPSIFRDMGVPYHHICWVFFTSTTHLISWPNCPKGRLLQGQNLSPLVAWAFFPSPTSKPLISHPTSVTEERPTKRSQSS